MTARLRSAPNRGQEATIFGTITVDADCSGTMTVGLYDRSGTTLLRSAV